LTKQVNEVKEVSESESEDGNKNKNKNNNDSITNNKFNKLV